MGLSSQGTPERRIISASYTYPGALFLALYSTSKLEYHVKMPFITLKNKNSKINLN